MVVQLVGCCGIVGGLLLAAWVVVVLLVLFCSGCCGVASGLLVMVLWCWCWVGDGWDRVGGVLG